MFSGLDDNGTTVQFELKSRVENFNEQGMGANKKYATSLYLRCEPADDSTLDVFGNADAQGFERLEEGADLSLSVDHPSLPVTLPFTLSGIDTIRFEHIKIVDQFLCVFIGNKSIGTAQPNNLEFISIEVNFLTFHGKNMAACFYWSN